MGMESGAWVLGEGRGFYTHYWSNATWDVLEAAGFDGGLFRHTAGGGFLRRGVGSGDLLFGVTVFGGTAYLLGVMEVGAVCGRAEAAEALGVRPGELFGAAEHVLARRCTRMRFGRVVDEGVAGELRFVSGRGRAGGRPLARARRGHAPGLALDRQALRGVRRLAEASGVLLAEAVLAAEAPEPSGLSGLEGGSEEETRVLAGERSVTDV